MMVEEDILTVGDLHLTGLTTLFGDRGDDHILACLGMAVDYARRNGITKIILPGDLFDHPHPSQEAVARLLRFFLQNADLLFLAIPGNHDYRDASTLAVHILRFIDEARLIPNLRMFTKPAFEEIDGLPFYFMPWPHLRHVEPVDRPVINIAHIKISGALADNGRPIDKGDEIEVGRDYWIIGDLHRYQRIGKRVVYPGTMFQKTFGEPLPKGFLHSTIRAGRTTLKVEHKYVPIKPPFQLINLTVESPDDLAKVSADPADRYKLFIKADVAIPADFLEKHPNVVNVLGYKTKVELDALAQGSLAPDEVPVFDVEKIATDNLADFLSHKGLDKNKVKKARQIVGTLIAGLDKKG